MRLLAKRFLLTFGGELVQSALHFGMSVALVRMLSPGHYGVFAILMTVGGVALTYMRALVGMPVALLVSQRRGTRPARAYETTFGSAAIILAIVIGCLTALMLDRWMQADALSGSLFVGLWSLRSYLRTAMLAAHRQMQAGASDLALAGAGAILGVLFLHADHPGRLNTALCVLAGANLFAIATALVLAGTPPRITFRPSMWRRLSSMSRQLAWSAANTTTATVQAQGITLLIAAFSGPKAYAPIAAVLVLFSPVRLLAIAAVNMVQPELATRHAQGRLPPFGHLMVLWAMAVIALASLYGGVVYLALPLMGTAVFQGESAVRIGVLIWVITVTFLISIVPRAMLEILRQFKRAAMISIVASLLGLSIVVLLLSTTTPVLSLLGNVAAEVLVLAWSCVAVSGALRNESASSRPANQTSPPPLTQPI